MAEPAKTTKTADKDKPSAFKTAALAPTRAKAGEGATLETLATDENEHIEVAADPTGIVSNRVEGTIQREMTPEEYPTDARVAPIAEQLAPNSAPQAIGALPQPEEVAGVKQPEEGEKNVTSDMSDPTEQLPEDSEQEEEAERAKEDAERDADRGRV